MGESGEQTRFKGIPELSELGDKYREMDIARHRLEERILELFTLYEINKALSLSMNLDDLFATTMNLLGEALSIHEYSLLLLDDETQELVIKASHGLSDETVRTVRFAVGEGISGQAFQKGVPIMVPDVSMEPDFLYYKWQKRDVGSFISVPLKLSHGRIIGVLNAHRAEKNSFTPFDEKLFMSVAEHVAIAVERTNIYEKTRELSIKDSLTGIYNRRYFFENAEQEIARTRRNSRHLSLILVDIDDFKLYNDHYGHQSGDEALKITAQILEKNLRQGDVLARYGGEEFIIMLPETDKQAAMGVAEKLRQAVHSSGIKREDLGPDKLVSVTLGVASHPGDGDEIGKLVNMADRFMYLGKAQGKNRVVGEHIPCIPKE